MAFFQPPSHNTSTPVRVDILEEDRIRKNSLTANAVPPNLQSSEDSSGRAAVLSPNTDNVSVSKPFRVGILSPSRASHKHAAAIANPASSCSVAGLASRNAKERSSFTDEWRKHSKLLLHGNQSDEVVVKEGEQGYDDLINSEGVVDALYIPLPTAVNKDYVIKALRAGKHVLVQHPVSESVSDYVDMINTAHESKKFLMDSTMFVHHHRLEEFLECVTGEKQFGQVRHAGRRSVRRLGSVRTFGQIRRIEASCTIHGDDPDMSKTVWPSRNDGDVRGCIGVLGWYCIRAGVVIFTRVGSGSVKSVQVTEVVKNEKGVPIDAKCLVKFDKDRVLKFHCSFTHATRQILEVISDDRSASIVDFVYPHDVFTSYQVHEHAKSDGEHRIIEKTDSVECEAGPAQEVMLWRTFARLSRGIDEAVALEKLTPRQKKDEDLSGSISGMGWGESQASMEALEFSSVSVQTQMIVDALMESVANEGTEVTLFPSYQFPRV